MQAGADDKLGAGVDGGLGLLSRRHGAGAEQKLLSVLALQFLEQVHRAGHGHGDFNDGHATGDHGFDNGAPLGNAFGAQDWDQALAFDDFPRTF